MGSIPIAHLGVYRLKVGFKEMCLVLKSILLKALTAIIKTLSVIGSNPIMFFGTYRTVW